MRTVHGDHCLDAGRKACIGLFRFELWIVAGHSQHRDQVSAGGTTDRSDVVGVDVIFVSMFSEKANGGFTILQVAWPDLFEVIGEARMSFCQLVVDAGTDVAGFGQIGADVDFAAGAFVTTMPASAMAKTP